MTKISTEELERLVEYDDVPGFDSQRLSSMARELLAARKLEPVVWLYRKSVREGFPMDRIHEKADAALTEYDEATQ